MFSRAHASPRVCLSCWLRLAPRRATRRANAPRRDSARSLRQYSSRDVEPDDGSPDANKAKLLALIRSRYYNKFLDKKVLPHEALGKPATALVLKNPSHTRFKKLPYPMVDEEPPPKATSVTADHVISTHGSGPESPEAIFKSIDEMRPSDTQVLSQHEMKKLMRALDYGFTIPQLQGYIEAAASKRTPAADEANSYDWIVKRQPWTPAVEGRVVKKPSKLHDVTTIVTGIWGLVAKDRMRDPGTMRVWLQPSVFQFLFRPTSQFLQTLTTECLGESKQWRITPENAKFQLEIYSPKEVASTVLARIDEAVQRISTRTLSLDGTLGSGDISRAALDELERMTGSMIQRVPKKTHLVVSWMADEKTPPPHASREPGASPRQQTEDLADVVLRCLMAPKASPGPGKCVVLPTMEQDQPADTRPVFVPHYRGSEALVLSDKMQQWSRRINPSRRRSYGAHVTRTPIVGELSLPSPVFKTEEGRSTNRITATFGHVLHAGSAPQSNTRTARRVLYPVVPHPASFTSIGERTSKPAVQSTAILLNFAPMHTSDTPLNKRPPPLRLTLPVNVDSDLSNFTLPPNSTLEGVLAPWHITDVLLPDEYVDVRIAQQRVLTLDTNQPSLKEFLAASEFNLLKGRLRTPSCAYFSIPNEWMSPKPKSKGQAKALESSAAGASTDKGRLEALGEPRSGSTETRVPYRFFGLEIHQMVDLELDGYTLRYNSIEAGHQGGQRQEISLVAVSDRGSGGAESTETADKFLRAVQEVAFGELFFWHKGNMMIQDVRVTDDVDWRALGRSDDVLGAMKLPGQGAEADLPVWDALPPPMPADARKAPLPDESPTFSATARQAQRAPGVFATSTTPPPRVGRPKDQPVREAVRDPDWVRQLRSMVRKD